MNDVYINEKSLDGQFASLEDFLNSSMEFIKCLEWLRKRSIELRVLKKSDLYMSKITQEHCFHDLMGYKVSSPNNTNDILRKMKISLLNLQNCHPFWDCEKIVQEGLYQCNNLDITGTSIAEAVATKGVLLSFYNQYYNDINLSVINNGSSQNIFSIATVKGMAESLYEAKKLEINDYLKLYYRNTRLNFTYLEVDYGLQNFQKSEINECLSSFNRFVELDDWGKIYNDTSLVYKAYSPSKKENWFKESQYNDKKIDKFRCVNPKRCFGFKEKDIFYVLRIERDHKISDKG